jgi:hypothetical protein
VRIVVSTGILLLACSAGRSPPSAVKIATPTCLTSSEQTSAPAATTHGGNDEGAAERPVEADSSNIRETTDASLLQLTIARIELPPELAHLAQVALRFTLRNATWNRQLWVNRSLLLHHKDSPIANTWLEIRDEQGQEVLPNCRIRGSVSDRSWDYVLLGPAGEISVVVTLQCFSFRPGKYQVTAHWREIAQKPPIAPPVSQWFRGELISAPIEIKIIK